MSDQALLVLDELKQWILEHKIAYNITLPYCIELTDLLREIEEIRTRMAASQDQPFFIEDRFNPNLSVFFDWNENGGQFMLWVKNTLENKIVWRLGDIRVNDVRRNHGCNDYSLSKLGLKEEKKDGN